MGVPFFLFMPRIELLPIDRVAHPLDLIQIDDVTVKLVLQGADIAACIR